MGDFLAFRKMIAPYVIQVIFWTGAVAIVVASIGAISQDQALVGFLLLIFGVLYWRVACEFLIVFFRMNDTLRSIKVDTTPIPPALASRGWVPETGATRTREPALVASPVETVSRDQAAEHPAAAAAAGGATVASVSQEGWYDDTERPGHTRWWDGTEWGIRDDEHPSKVSGSPHTNAEDAPAAEPPPETRQEPAAPETGSAPLQASVRFCENCGAARSPNARFCTSCGHA